MVTRAWPMERWEERQRWYCQVCRDNLRRLKRQRPASATLLPLARDASAAYCAAMELDPLLPKSLWPEGYLGQEAYRLHQQLLREIGRRLK